MISTATTSKVATICRVLQISPAQHHFKLLEARENIRMNRSNSTSSRWTRPLLAFVAALLTACGGGGGGSASSCSNGQNVFTDITVDVNAFFAPKVGDVISLNLQTTGIPASCQSARIFSLASGSLPAGLTLNASSGRISGTLTTAGSWSFILRVELAGFSGSVSAGVEANVADPALYTLSTPSSINSNLPMDNFQLTALGGQLVAPGQSFGDISGLMSANVSNDAGLNWSPVAVGAQPMRTSGFSVTADAGRIYVLGGFDANSNTYLSSTSTFDGTTWSAVTSVSTMPGRRDALLMVDGAGIYAVGGADATGPLSDVWFSGDGGVNWSQRSANYAGSTITGRTAVCAGRLGAGFALISRRPAAQFPNPDVVEVWTSTDGSNWSAVTVPAHSPLLAVNPNPAPQCVVAGGRLYLFASNWHSVGTSDLVNWHFEPVLQAGPFSGAAVLDGVIYLADGVGTSQRSLVGFTLLP